MAELKLGYKHDPKDRNKFKPIAPEQRLTNLRFGNNTFIELGRSEGQIMRTLWALFGLCCSIGWLIVIGALFFIFTTLTKYSSKWEVVVIFGAIVLAGYGFLLSFFQFFIKNTIWPNDYPVRFNRKTGKVYVYEPQLSKRSYYFPIREITRLYRPVVKVFDWQDLEGMATRKGLALQQVFFAAVINRQSDTLIDHFALWDNANFFNNEEWRWLLSYMDGMEGLNYQGKIRGRFWLGRLFNCFAPEFSWPEGIDKASRAESLIELAQIEQQYDLVGKMYPYQQP